MRVPLPRGVILLYTMLILGVTSLLALTIIAKGSLGGYINANAEASAAQARAVVFSCVDEFLLHVQKDSAFSPASVSVADGTCSLTVSQSGSERSALLLYTSGDITRGVRVVVDTTTPFSVTSLEETLN